MATAKSKPKAAAKKGLKPAPSKSVATKAAPVKTEKSLKAAPKGKESPTSKSTPKAKVGFDFIGVFPMKKDSDKKNDLKKQPAGPVFPQGDYILSSRFNPLSLVLVKEFESTYLGKHTQDSIKIIHSDVVKEAVPPLATAARPNTYTRELDEALLNSEIDIAIHNMKDIPLELTPGLVLAASLRREDPRDALVTRSTIGAIQELGRGARVGTSSRRRIMQIKAVRSDLQIIPVSGDVQSRLEQLEKIELDAVLVPWASLRRLSISPRYYVSLQPDQMTPAAAQGTIGVICRADSTDLIAKLRYIEDSEASWSARCERAFMAKMGATRDSPVGVYAHRKGTQDPWILDAVIGDATKGELLRHREIGTSRCKPESLADKAFVGIISKGARKFLPFA